MKLSTRLALACGAVFGLAAAALGMPELLKQTPDNAAIIITIPNPARMEKNLQALTTATELPLPPFGVKDLLMMGGFMDGVAADKAIAIVVSVPADKSEKFDPSNDERVVVLLPVTDYGQLLGNFDAKPTGGVDSMTTQDGETLFVRDLKNGYAALSKSKPAVEGYTPGKGDSISAGAGAAGTALIDASDLVIIGNVDVLRPFMDKAIEEVKAAAKEQMESMPMGNGQVPDLDSPLTKWMQERVTQDTRMVVSGLKLGALGVSLDTAASFKKDSYLGKVFTSDAGAGSLLGKLPIQPYLLIAALDTSAAPFKQLVKDFAAKAKESAPADKPMPENLFGGSLEEADGQAAIIGFNPGIMMGAGVFTSTVSYTKTGNVDKLMADNKARIEALNGFDSDDMSIKATYTPGGATYGEAKRPMDVWETKLTPKNADPQAVQGLSMMFGPSGGPSGYIVKGDGGFYTTYAKNTALVTSAVEAAAAGGKNIASDAALKQVADNLPRNRVAELYVGTKSIVDTLLPLGAMMAGIQIDPASLPQDLPPIAASIANNAGSGHFTIFIPAPVLKTGAIIAQKLQEMQAEAQDGMEEPGNDNMGDEGDASGTGQPKF